MWSKLALSLFIIVLAADTTKALNKKDSYDEEHGNHSAIQPRQDSISVNLDARSLTTLTIQTARFPRPYRSFSDINWNVKATCDMELYCPVFDLRPKNRRGCRDYLEIKDGDQTERFCGEELNGGTYISSTGQIDLTFKSKRNGPFIGFNCTISCHRLNPKCSCGVYSPPVTRNDKIVGGNETRENQFPWQAVMVWYNSNVLHCGGSLINNQWVLSAAHCTDGVNPSDIQILLGAQCLTNPPPGQLRLDVLSIIQNDGYDSITFDNDIALLKLETFIDFATTYFSPVCLPVTNNNPIPDEDDVEAVISGFGTLEAGGDLPDCLQYAIVPTMNNTFCQSFYPYPITENMICAGFPGIGGIDSCQGDSGGPMVNNATSDSLPNYYVQIGIVSWGKGCAEPDYPGVYARVSEYIDWININTAGSSTCPPP